MTMKTTNYLLVAAAVAATFTFASQTSATDVLLSPRAYDNLIKTTDIPTTGSTLGGIDQTGNAKIREHLASIASAPGTTEDMENDNTASTFDTFALIRPRQAEAAPSASYEVAPVEIVPAPPAAPDQQ